MVIHLKNTYTKIKKKSPFFSIILYTDCGTIAPPEHGSISYSSRTTYMSVATFSGDKGYTLSHTTNRACQANNTWNNDNPHCITFLSIFLYTDCGTIALLEHGSIYSLSHTTSRTCQANSTWNNGSPHCITNSKYNSRFKRLWWTSSK